jgi:hypothetical protein
MAQESRLDFVMVSTVLALLLGVTVGIQETASGASGVQIVGNPRSYSSERIDLGRPFETTPCASRRSGETSLAGLLADAKMIAVHRFEPRRWRDLDEVRAYVVRLLAAVPEGGAPSPGVYWAELREGEIIASVEFADGRRAPFHLGNGYAHVQDSAGCEWWGRYLGPDRSRWIVWPR